MPRGCSLGISGYWIEELNDDMDALTAELELGLDRSPPSQRRDVVTVEEGLALQRKRHQWIKADGMYYALVSGRPWFNTHTTADEMRAFFDSDAFVAWSNAVGVHLIRTGREASDARVEHIALMPELSTYEGWSPDPPAKVGPIVLHDALRSLELELHADWDEEVLESVIERLPTLPQLRRLKIGLVVSRRKGEAASLALFERLFAGLERSTSLEEVYLDEGFISPGMAASLGRMRRLETLTVFNESSQTHYIHRPEQASLRGLSASKTLRVFKVYNVGSFTSADYDEIAAIPALEELHLTTSGLSDEDVARLAGSRRLRVLNLGHHQLDPAPVMGTPTPRRGNITDAGVQALTRLERLETLLIDGQRLTASSHAHFAAMPNLRKLFIDHDLGGDVAWLSRLPRLTWLGIDAQDFDEAALEQVFQIKTLAVLKYNKGPSVDEGTLDRFAAMPALRVVVAPTKGDTDALKAYAKGVAPALMLRLRGP